MNLKKFISGISALTIAASAFAGMAVTANAAYVYDVLYGVESANGVADQTDFTGDDHEATGATFADANNNSQFVIDGSVLVDGDATWTKNFTTAKTTGKVYFNATYTVSANNSNMIKLLSSNGTVIYQSSQQTTNGNANQEVATICGTKVTSWVRQARNAGYRIELVIDLDAKSVNYKSVASSGNGSVNTQTGNVKLTAADVQGLQVTKSTYGYKMDSVALYSEVDPADLKYTYTLNYKLGTETIRTDSASVSAGSEISAEIPFWKDGVKYFAADGATTSLTVSASGNNTLDIPVRAADNYTCTLKSTGAATFADKVQTITEGETYVQTYPQFIINNGTAYEASKNDSGYQYYTGSVTNNINNSVTYTKKYDNVVFFEDLDADTVENASSRASNGSAYCNRQYTSSQTIKPGTYTFVFRLQDKDRESVIKVGNTVILDYATIEGKDSWKDWEVKNVKITTEAPIQFTTGDGKKTVDCLDTILVYGTVDPAVSISAVDSTTTKYDDKTFTLAKLLVDVVGSVKAINVTYGTSTQKATDMNAITDGTIVLGAIVDGNVNVTTSTFDVTVAE